jgi:hypothetical protein
MGPPPGTHAVSVAAHAGRPGGATASAVAADAGRPPHGPSPVALRDGVARAARTAIMLAMCLLVPGEAERIAAAIGPQSR